MRYFRSAQETYEQIRIALDDAWGLPDQTTVTETCLPPAEQATKDTQGRCIVAVPDAFCSFTVAVDLLPDLLASGAVTEITEAEYRAAVESPSPVS
jgi:hypothetical protein